MKTRPFDQCFVRAEPEGDGQTAGKRFHEPLSGVRLPQGNEMGDLPTLSTGPLQRRRQSSLRGTSASLADGVTDGVTQHGWPWESCLILACTASARLIPSDLSVGLRR